MTEQRKIPQDRHGNFFFEVGDLVTRDGTDVHRVVDHNGSDGHAPDGMTVVCIKAPSEPWIEVGEEEFNVCRRYSPVGEDEGVPAADWIGSDVKLTEAGTPQGVRLHRYQRAMMEAMSGPVVSVRFARPPGLSPYEIVCLMALAPEATVMVFERVAVEDAP